MDYKLVIVVREDLELSKGKLAAQVGHASVSCALSAKNDNPKWFKSWMQEGQRKVVVKASSIEELYELETHAKRFKVTTSLIVDAGLTEIPAGTITCLGVGPGPGNIIDQITGKLKLL